MSVGGLSAAWNRYLVTMQDSLADFRQFLRRHANEGDSEKAHPDITGQWLHHEESDEETDIRGKWQTGSGSDVSSSGNGSSLGDIRGVWHRSESEGCESSTIQQDNARLERIFPRLIMLVTKRIGDNWNSNQPQLGIHITLFKPVTAMHLIFASVNAVYCRHTTFCGALIQMAYNPLSCRTVLQEQITHLSIVSEGRIIQAEPSAREHLHHQLKDFSTCRNFDFPCELEPNCTLSVIQFQEDTEPASRSEALLETIRNLLAVIAVCPISTTGRLELRIDGCDADDLDTLTPLVS